MLIMIIITLQTSCYNIHRVMEVNAFYTHTHRVCLTGDMSFK